MGVIQQAEAEGCISVCRTVCGLDAQHTGWLGAIVRVSAGQLRNVSAKKVSWGWTVSSLRAR